MVNSLFILFLKISLAHIKNKKFSRIPDYIPLVEYSGIHSLIKKFNTDYMLTKSHKERDSLLATNKEICVCNPSSHSYCTGGSADDLNTGLSGPFVMFNKSGANRKPLFRCKSGDKTSSLLKRKLGFVKTADF